MIFVRTNNYPKRKLILPLLWLSLIVSLPSTGLIQKYLHNVGAGVYILTVFCSLSFLIKIVFENKRFVVTEVQAGWIIITAFISLLGLFFIFNAYFPQWNYRVDRDEALDIAATELLDGRYPYYPKTQLENPISPLPGAILLTVPFTLLGTSAYQNFFWLFILLIIVWKLTGDLRIVSLYFLSVFFLSLATLQEWIFGGDLISNNIYILVGIIWFLEAIGNSHNSWTRLLATIFLGIVLSSRLNFLFWLPLIFSFVWQESNWKIAVRYASMAVFVFGGLTIPFYLYDPGSFSPLHTLGKIGGFTGLIPHADLIAVIVTSIVAFVFAIRKTNHEYSILFLRCAIVQIIPLLLTVVLSSFEQQSLDFLFLKERFGLNFLFIGGLACWLVIKNNLAENSSNYRSLPIALAAN